MNARHGLEYLVIIRVNGCILPCAHMPWCTDESIKEEEWERWEGGCESGSAQLILLCCMKSSWFKLSCSLLIPTKLAPHRQGYAFCPCIMTRSCSGGRGERKLEREKGEVCRAYSLGQTPAECCESMHVPQWQHSVPRQLHSDQS